MATTNGIKLHARVGFDKEADLVTEFVALLTSGSSPWGKLQVTQEWNYESGVTDVLVRCGQEIIAFEAKLTDWRRAAHQAYKNTIFVGRAYVVMPQTHASRAAAHPGAFERYGVGLCAVEPENVRILISARHNQPLIPRLHDRAQDYFDQDRPQHRHAKCRPTALPAIGCPV